MKNKFFLASLLLVLNFPAWGTVSYGTLNGGAAIGAIADNSTIGLTDAHTVGGLGSSLTTLTLTFVLQGGFASDLSGYLRLGDSSSSPYYDLTTLIQSQTLTESAANTYTIDFATTGFGTAFNGQNPNGTWTLFFADTSAGGTSTLNGWSLNITAVPEPVNVALGAFGLGLTGVTGIRWYCTRRKAMR